MTEALLVAVAPVDVPVVGATCTGALGAPGLPLLTYLAVLAGALAWAA